MPECICLDGPCSCWSNSGECHAALIAEVDGLRGLVADAQILAERIEQGDQPCDGLWFGWLHDLRAHRVRCGPIQGGG